MVPRPPTETRHEQAHIRVDPQAPAGQWQASYWHEGARHLAPWTFGTKSDAVRWLSTTHHDLSRGQWFDPRRAQVRFDEWADSWTKNVVDLRPSTFVRDVDYAG